MNPILERKKNLLSFSPQACLDLQKEIRQIAKLVNVKNLKGTVTYTDLIIISNINQFIFLSRLKSFVNETVLKLKSKLTLDFSQSRSLNFWNLTRQKNLTTTWIFSVTSELKSKNDPPHLLILPNCCSKAVKTNWLLQCSIN